MAELEEAERTRKETEAKDKGQWTELVESKDQRIGKLTEESNAKDAKIAELQAQIAERDILAGIVEKAGGDVDPKLVRAAYRDVVGSKGLDVAPKDLDVAVKERHEILTKEYPKLFEAGPAPKPRPGGGSPKPRPGKKGGRGDFNLL